MTPAVSQFLLHLAGSISLFEGLDAHAREALARDLRWFSLPGGWTLFKEGEPGDALFVVVSGRLGVVTAAGGDSRLLAEIAPGEVVGEMALISGDPRSATVVAMRDTQLVRLDKAAFDRLALECPALMRSITALLVRRLNHTSHRPPAMDAPRTVTLLPLCAEIPIAEFADSLCKSLSAMGRRVMLLDEQHAERGTEFFSAVEDDHDLVIYRAQCADSGWTRMCLRQSDRLLLAAMDSTSLNPTIDRLIAAKHRGATDMVIYHAACGGAVETSVLLERYQPHIHCHVREGSAGDMGRLGRLLLGRAVGAVLSGGGARGFAHIGVIKALRRAGITLDLVCGASMGSLVAAAAALEMSEEEMMRHLVEAFVETNPLSDYTVPIVAISRGRKVSRLLQEHFGTSQVEECWRHFFCTSSDLSTAQVRIHKSGPLWRALRASIAIPGVLMPVVEDGHLLVDGGVLNNMPVDLLLGMRRGPVIAVDVMKRHSLWATNGGLEEQSLWKLMSAHRRGSPNIVALLMRAGTVGSDFQVETLRSRVDLLIEAKAETIGMLDWNSYQAAIDMGYEHTMRLLEERDSGVLAGK